MVRAGKLLHLIDLHHVGGDRQRPTSPCPDLVGDGLDLVGSSSRDNDRGTCLGETEGDPLADTAATAGDDGHLAVEAKSVDDVRGVLLWHHVAADRLGIRRSANAASRSSPPSPPKGNAGTMTRRDAECLECVDVRACVAGGEREHRVHFDRVRVSAVLLGDGAKFRDQTSETLGVALAGEVSVGDAGGASQVRLDCHRRRGSGSMPVSAVGCT